MPTSLYDISVPSYLQTVTAVAGYLDKGFEFCTGKGIDVNEIVESKIVCGHAAFPFPDLVSRAPFAGGR